MITAASVPASVAALATWAPLVPSALRVDVEVHVLRSGDLHPHAAGLVLPEGGREVDVQGMDIAGQGAGRRGSGDRSSEEVEASLDIVGVGRGGEGRALLLEIGRGLAEVPLGGVDPKAGTPCRSSPGRCDIARVPRRSEDLPCNSSALPCND